MDILTFLANTIDSLAWPASVVALFALFRTPIGSLIEAIKNAKFKYKKGETSLEVAIEALVKRHPNLPIKPPSEEINRLVGTSPVKAIQKSWEELEATATAATAASEQYSSVQIADMLINKKLLTPSEAEVFSVMHEVKEEAIRPGGVFVTDVSSASTYTGLASGLKDKIIGTTNTDAVSSTAKSVE